MKKSEKYMQNTKQIKKALIDVLSNDSMSEDDQMEMVATLIESWASIALKNVLKEFSNEQSR